MVVEPTRFRVQGLGFWGLGCWASPNEENDLTCCILGTMVSPILLHRSHRVWPAERFAWLGGLGLWGFRD